MRFNWKTPFILSNHNSRIFYCLANRVFKSLERGANLRAISPDLTSTGKGTGTALSESPRDPNILYAGTDDGNLWVTTNGGTDWKKARIKGLKGKHRVSSIEASRFATGRCYVTLDGHYYDDDAPHVYMTDDSGKTWKAIDKGLPTGPARVIREDVSNANLLYLGTEFGVWVSLDRGETWMRLNNNLPHVAVHEIAVHPTAGEIVAGTHGRSLWILGRSRAAANHERGARRSNDLVPSQDGRVVARRHRQTVLRTAELSGRESNDGRPDLLCPEGGRQAGDADHQRCRR